MNEELKKLLNEIEANLQYFSENGIKVYASEDGELIDISYMAEESITKIATYKKKHQ